MSAYIFPSFNCIWTVVFFKKRKKAEQNRTKISSYSLLLPIPCSQSCLRFCSAFRTGILSLLCHGSPSEGLFLLLIPRITGTWHRETVAAKTPCSEFSLSDWAHWAHHADDWDRAYCAPWWSGVNLSLWAMRLPSSLFFLLFGGLLSKTYHENAIF